MGMMTMPDAIFLFIEVLMGVFDHHDGTIHHYANGNGDAAEAHDVGANVQAVKNRQTDNHAGGNHNNGDQRTAAMEEKNHADQSYNDHFFDQRIGKGVDGTVN